MTAKGGKWTLRLSGRELVSAIAGWQFEPTRRRVINNVHRIAPTANHVGQMPILLDPPAVAHGKVVVVHSWSGKGRINRDDPSTRVGGIISRIVGKRSRPNG